MSTSLNDLSLAHINFSGDRIVIDNGFVDDPNDPSDSLNTGDRSSDSRWNTNDPGEDAGQFIYAFRKSDVTEIQLLPTDCFGDQQRVGDSNSDYTYKKIQDTLMEIRVTMLGSSRNIQYILNFPNISKEEYLEIVSVISGAKAWEDSQIYMDRVPADDTDGSESDES